MKLKTKTSHYNDKYFKVYFFTYNYLQIKHQIKELENFKKAGNTIEFS